MSHFLYPIIHQHLLRLFHVLETVNNVALNIGCKYLLKIMISFPSRHISREGLLDHMVVVLLVFWGTTIIYPEWLVPVCIPANGAQRSLISTSSPTLIFCLFGNSHSRRCEIISLWFWFASLVISNAEHLFLLAICISLEKYLFKSSAHFKIKLWDFCYEVVQAPYIFWILTPYHVDGLQIFSSRGTWVAQSVQILGLSPMLSSLLSRESTAPSPSAPPHHSCSLSLR